MADSPTILFAGGGTGGHLYPGVSVAQALMARVPGARPVFLCTEREIDSVILTAAKLEFIRQPIVPPVKTIGGLLRFWESWRHTKDLVKRIIKDRRPAAVLGLGGYAAGVAVKIAGQRDIPTAILNPDVLPGKANQYLMRYARAVCCQFEQTREHVPQREQHKLQMTGCPIRDNIRALPAREEAKARLGLDRRLSTLVIAGGSQGAQTVSEATLETLKDLNLQGWQVLHLSGRDHAEAVRAGYRELTVPARVIDFTPEMADVYAVADLMINRAGASGCAEITACGIPSILMPYPFHKDMHQRANAKVLADAGAAVLLDDMKDRKANATALRPALEPLLHDASRRQEMSAKARALGAPDAADRVAELLGKMIG
jgi:UDP-N-acetylglucosamine--N-acetylmuramyl-(pentapeptide) pyrophosphoryl-undecaprenol N-acetylglucosamine transferase